ncbi:MAG: hypothetical protein O9346_06935 [Leptospiraceae bacterium]|nr:hypothetical protein [Leptospiraceae bacterium]
MMIQQPFGLSISLKNYLRNFIIIGIYLSPITFLQAQPNETLSQEECKVFEIFQYTIEWEDEYSIEFPKEGDITSEELDLVIGEVLKIQIKDHSATIDFRIFKPGEFTIPIQWKNSQSTAYILSEKKIRILSAISEKDSTEPSDYEAPIAFGNFLWYRLFLIVILIILLVFCMYILYKKYSSRPLDAIIEEPYIAPLDDILEDKFNSLIRKENLTKKEFAYFMTEFIQFKLPKSKNTITQIEVPFEFQNGIGLNQDQAHPKILTDADLLENIYKSYPMSTEDMRKMKVFFLFAKYSDTNECISTDEAKSMFEQWKQIMNTIQAGRKDA